MSRRIKTILMTFFSLTMSLVFFLSGFSGAQAQQFDPQKTYQDAYKGTFTVQGDAAVVVGNVIRTALTYIGVIVLLIVVYAGFLWATARGDEGQVSKSKTILMGAVIGLIIIFASSAIVSFVLTRLQSGLGAQ